MFGRRSRVSSIWEIGVSKTHFRCAFECSTFKQKKKKREERYLLHTEMRTLSLREIYVCTAFESLVDSRHWNASNERKAEKFHEVATHLFHILLVLYSVSHVKSKECLLLNTYWKLLLKCPWNIFLFLFFLWTKTITRMIFPSAVNNTFRRAFSYLVANL